MEDKDRAFQTDYGRAWSLKRLTEVVAERSNVRDQQASTKTARECRLEPVDGTGGSTP
jgi:hypothetical protein